MRIMLLLIQAAFCCAVLLSPQQARAETDCEHLQRVMSDLRTNRPVLSGDIGKAMATERSGACVASVPSTPPPVQPAQTPPAPMPSPSTPPMISGLTADFTSRALDPGRFQCPRGMRPDLASSDPCDWFALALAYQKGITVPQDPSQAIFWLEKAARAGHAAAQMGLGTAYESGYGPLDVNYAAAHHWMVMGAQNFNPVAARMLGSYSEYGTGTAVDFNQAAYWYDKALERGEIEAAVWLGLLHMQGKGVPQNVARGIDLIKLGAEQGDTNAMFNLGNYYRMGIGVPFDTAQARFWLRKAAARGDEDAVTVLAYMDEVDRRYASMPAGSGNGRAGASGPSFSDASMEAHRRQGRENCAAAAKGASRPCYIP